MLDDLAVDFPDAKLAVLGQTAEWLVFQGDWTATEERYRNLLTLVDETSLIDRLLSRLLIRQGRQVEARVLLQRLCKAGNVEEMDLRSLLSLSCHCPEMQQQRHLSRLVCRVSYEMQSAWAK